MNIHWKTPTEALFLEANMTIFWYYRPH